jgi:hypothetical protein
VGAFLVHTLELKQRYNNVTPAAVQALLNELSSAGVAVASTAGTNRWEIALKEGTWVQLTWHPDYSGLEITITDRELRPVERLADARHRYEALLHRLTPRLQSYGATTVGAAIVGQRQVGGQYGQQSIGRGGSTLGPRGRGAASLAVGLTVYHSVGDRAEAVKQMAVDWNTLYQSLASQVGELTPDPKSSSGYHFTTQKEWDAKPPDPKKVTWWKSYADPLFKQWNKFKSDQLGGDRTVAADYIAFAERFQTNWDVYESWKKKFDALRAEAQTRGFTVDTPKPTELPTTVWADVAHTVERGAEAVKTGIGDVWKLAKYGLWGALGIGAVVALSSVASNLRSGKDPGEKYMELIRRPRVSRALPAGRSQLALPPGTEGA